MGLGGVGVVGCMQMFLKKKIPLPLGMQKIKLNSESNCSLKCEIKVNVTNFHIIQEELIIV